MAREPGTIDADGHVLEPHDLWQSHLEAPLRERALRFARNDRRLEYIEIDGRPFPHMPAGMTGLFGVMGVESPDPTRAYADSIPFGASDPAERVELLEREKLARAVLYPTLGLLWDSVVEDPQLADAFARAYNRWIADFCRGSGGRLVPIAHLSLCDVELACRELERAVADGCRGAFVVPFTSTRIPHGHPHHDPLWARAQDLGVPVALHPAMEPERCSPLTRFDGLGGGSATPDAVRSWYSMALSRQGMQQAFATFFAYGTFERFPGLRLGVLESGAGWIGAFLDKLDAITEAGMAVSHATGLKLPPSEYFRRQCFISADPDETAAPRVVDHVGAHCFLWASDFPHGDHPANYLENLESFVAPLEHDTRSAVLGANVARLYGLD